MISPRDKVGGQPGARLAGVVGTGKDRWYLEALGWRLEEAARSSSVSAVHRQS